ncbi:hypothetical protein OIU80_03040 [Flavobacterium sp. LS1R47]|uniref:Methyltransferase domain-containing protein n=1 Tax=Flavobacterium frigoritolerans TaxID=2987686 RepID=A0A9X3C611_9FLAO|nr:hypothetical protein [Flavobacterium frigoritolerans]MCV9931244.1 hypothetical protein [Flavobacterium frigoritolerans]
MGKQDIAIETYKYFSSLEGNQHIASEFALKKIVDILENYKIDNILELGLGIGSISYCILEYSDKKINYIGTESNDFCLNALPKYLKNNFDKVKIVDSLSKVLTTKKFDLIIVDGKDENLLLVKKSISNRGIIVIEGDRIPQLELIKNSFPNSLYVRLISNYKNPDYGPFPSTDWSGGLQLIFTNPNLLQKLNFGYYKIITAIRYRLRIIKKIK